jgi:hypothetical protein
MPFALSTQTLIQEFFLVNLDRVFGVQNEPTRFEVRCHTVNDESLRMELLHSVIWDDTDLKDVIYTLDLSTNDVWLKEVYLTLADCNICEVDDIPLFRFKDKRIDMTEEEFQLAWGRLPIEYAEEIINCVHIMNPQWQEKVA